MVNQAGGLRLAVGVEVKPLVFVAAESDRLSKPVPAKILGRDRGEDFILFGLVRLSLLDLLEKCEPALFPQGVALDRGL